MTLLFLFKNLSKRLFKRNVGNSIISHTLKKDIPNKKKKKQ